MLRWNEFNNLHDRLIHFLRSFVIFQLINQGSQEIELYSINHEFFLEMTSRFPFLISYRQVKVLLEKRNVC